MSSDILSNFLLLDNQVQDQEITLSVVNNVKLSGELLVGNGTGPDRLDPSTGLDGQILKRDTGTALGVSWAANVGLSPSGVVADTYLNGTFTVDANGIITDATQGNINNVAPTTTKGDLMVRNNSEVVRLPVGTDGQYLVSDSNELTGVKWYSIAFDDITPTTTKGDLITENNVGTVRLALGTDNQQLIVDTTTPTGLKWSDPTPAITLDEITPTTATGDLIVQNDVGNMVALPIGAAPDGYVLTVNSTVTDTKLEWAAPPSGGGSTVYNIVENANDGSATIVNITMGTYPHNTMFVINPNGNTDTQFVYNLPSITVAEQGLVYRFSVYTPDTGFGYFWQIIPDGTDLIEFTSYLDSLIPTTQTFQATNGNPAYFDLNIGTSPSGVYYGANVTLMAFKPATGDSKWLSVGICNGLAGPGGGGGS